VRERGKRKEKEGRNRGNKGVRKIERENKMTCRE
jgi:hypothetical protein